MTVRRMPLLIFALGCAMQAAFWWHTREDLPKPEVVPIPQTPLTAKAFAFGDDQFYFRILNLRLQNLGDLYGQFTALKDYNYERLYQWFLLCDGLDRISNFTPSLASYYYAQTQNTPDIRYVVDYLEEHSLHAPQKKWWWLAQAVYLARYKLNDLDRALEIAQQAATIKDTTAPIWVRQLPAFIHEARGETDAALAIIASVLKNEKNISEGEMNFMRYFIEERLQKAGELLEDK